jgi:hypothetical protein
MAEEQDGCVQPAKGPIGPSETDESLDTQQKPQQKESKVVARVGSPAPDFEATAYLDGGFKNVKLSDYKGQWVVLCFYPGDFTFV